MAALPSVGPRPSAQSSESMVKLLHFLTDRQIYCMAKIVAGFVAKEGVSQFYPKAEVQYQDSDADIINLDVLTKLEELAANFLERGLTENIRNGPLSIFSQKKAKALEYTFQDLLDTSPNLAKRVNPDLYSDFSIKISIQQDDKGTPVLDFVVGSRTEQCPIGFKL